RRTASPTYADPTKSINKPRCAFGSGWGCAPSGARRYQRMLLPSECWRRGCKHFRGVDQSADPNRGIPEGTELTERYDCDAFPEGIPHEITTGENLHLEPYQPSLEHPEGDHNIQFEMDEKLSNEELFRRQFGDVL